MSFPTSQTADIIKINDLELVLPLKCGAQWPTTDEPNQAVLQPLRLTVSVSHDTRQAAASDTIDNTVDYSALAKMLHKKLSAWGAFDSPTHVAGVLCQSIIEEHADGPSDHFKLTVVQPKASLLCTSVSCSYSATRVHGQWQIDATQHGINGLLCPTIIGIHPYEREARQETLISIEVDGDDVRHLANLPLGRALVRQMYESIYYTKYFTLEALASYVAKMVLSIVSDDTIPVSVTVSAKKPHAIPLASGAEVVIRRTSSDFVDVPAPSDEQIESLEPSFDIAHTGANQVAVLAFGSNMGDRFRNIEYALRLLEIPGEILGDVPTGSDARDFMLHITDTSFLYETSAMYVTGQPPFINGACVVETNLSPLTLLKLLKRVEEIAGRVPSVRHGPRAVDIDLIFYGNLVYDTRPAVRRNDLDLYENQLIIPHARVAEREFVLRPLNDMIPDFVHPALQRTVRQLLQKVDTSDQVVMHKAIPFPKLPLSPENVSPYPSISPVPETATHWTYRTSSLRGFRTHVMATLNATPDSFSDGSAHNTLVSGLEYVKESVSAGASIVDIGGYSTRPGAPFVPLEEELERVVPFVKGIREGKGNADNEQSSMVSMADVLISVDTFRPEVAEAAIAAGANCINDVYAFAGQGTYEGTDEAKVVSAATMDKMKAITRKYVTPAVLMHSRGDAGKNKDYSMYKYARDAVVEGIRIELGEKVEKIVKGKGGVRRWLFIVDPGIGFSKTLEGNLGTLKNAADIIRDVAVGKENNQRNPLAGYPQLIGVSRKSFLGNILSEGENARETAPNERTWATAAAVTCAVQQGAVVARVHDVREMVDVVKVADALWR